MKNLEKIRCEKAIRRNIQYYKKPLLKGGGTALEEIFVAFWRVGRGVMPLRPYKSPPIGAWFVPRTFHFINRRKFFSRIVRHGRFAGKSVLIYFLRLIRERQTDTALV